MGTWLNADGLYVKFGTSEATEGLAGGVQSYSNRHTIELDFDHADLAGVGTTKIMSDTVTIPNGYNLESATLHVETAFVGATGTLTIGTIDQDRSTVIDADGIDAAIAVAALTAGAEIACDGAQIDTVLSNTALITMLNGTADFTAGKAKLVLVYYKPVA